MLKKTMINDFSAFVSTVRWKWWTLIAEVGEAFRFISSILFVCA